MSRADAVSAEPTYRRFFTAVLDQLDLSVRNPALRAFGVLVIIEGRNTYWNPLNAVIPVPGSTPLPHNAARVQRYPNQAAGVTGTVKLLTQPRWKWALAAMACATNRSLILRQFQVEYATWGSHPDFYGPTMAQADQVLDAVMHG